MQHEQSVAAEAVGGGHCSVSPEVGGAPEEGDVNLALAPALERGLGHHLLRVPLNLTLCVWQQILDHSLYRQVLG